jgi:Zn-dependent peptidase ImmA (M78 family)
MPTIHTNRGAKRAREARERFGLDTSSPVDCLLTLVERDAGLPVVVGAMPDDVAGALYRNGTGSVAWVNGGQWIERQRFTLAHELGHVCCGHHGSAVDTIATISGASHDAREVEANAFAATLLAPADGVRAMVRAEPSLEDVVRIAARFGISTIAALYRLNTLGLATAKRSERLKAEIEARLHVEVWKYLELEPMRDELSAIDELPRLSPSLEDSALGALLRGETTPGAAAGSAGCRAQVLGAAAADLAR